MDFFEHQDQSRKTSRLLVLLFCMGVAGIVLAVYAAISALFYYSGIETGTGVGRFNWLDVHRFLWVTLATLALILGASLLKIRSLRQGGSYVAESLGGRPIDPYTSDPDERRLVNVVEEMSIAAGIPVPLIYLLDKESGINAFAAGYTQDDAVIGVTEGCLEKLNRDELQGVVAHEFSHILNGDMRLNIHLIGLISGILVLTVLGRILLRPSRRISRNKGHAAIMMMGLALMLIGFFGVLVSRLIQNAVSRQREYLSDASAVQFTRNPSGIANALKKIGGFATGSDISSPRAIEAGHLFFGSIGRSLFSTHPPIEQRIRRIDASFTGDPGGGSGRFPSAGNLPGFSPMATVMGHEQGHEQSLLPEAVTGRIGTLPVENIAYSAEMLAAIPPDVRSDLRDPFGATCVIYALLLDADMAQKKNQMTAISSVAPRETVARMVHLDRSIAGLPPELKLPLIDLSIPALRWMSPEQYRVFKRYVAVLVEADGSISLFEFAVQQIVVHRLDVAFHPRAEKERYRSIEPLQDDAVVILSKLAVLGHADIDEGRRAFAMAMKRIPVSGRSADLVAQPADVTLADVGRAITRFTGASPGVKRVLLDACAHCVLYDHVITTEEGELLRAVAYALDLPIPPFLVYKRLSRTGQK